MIASGTRFWTWAGLIALVNFVLIGAVLFRGDQTDVLPASFSPGDGATGVSTQPTVRITYPWPVDAAALRATFQIDPPAEGRPELNGGELTFTPSRPLLPNTTYAVTVPAGVREAGGKVSRQDARFSFTTRPSRLIVLRKEGRAENAWGVDPSSGTTWPITTAEGEISPIAPSPDGDEIAYVLPEGPRRWTLWSARLDGGGTRAVARNDDNLVMSMAWSSRGGALAYESRQVSEGGKVSTPKIWLTRPRESTASLLYGRSEETGSLPVWSPDGRALAFYENRFKVVAVFNFTKTLLTIPARLMTVVSWSPRGDALAYTDADIGSDDRTVVKVAPLASESHLGVPITQGTASDSGPAWSPTGEWIAVVRRTAAGEGIWAIRPEQPDEARPLHEDGNWTYTPPVWAPDGSAVAFSRFPASSGPGQTTEVWVAPLGGEPHRLDAKGIVAAWVP